MWRLLGRKQKPSLEKESSNPTRSLLRLDLQERVLPSLHSRLSSSASGRCLRLSTWELWEVSWTNCAWITLVGSTPVSARPGLHSTWTSGTSTVLPLAFWSVLALSDPISSVIFSLRTESSLTATRNKSSRPSSLTVTAKLSSSSWCPGFTNPVADIWDISSQFQGLSNFTDISEGKYPEWNIRPA